MAAPMKCQKFGKSLTKLCYSYPNNLFRSITSYQPLFYSFPSTSSVFRGTERRSLVPNVRTALLLNQSKRYYGECGHLINPTAWAMKPRSFSTETDTVKCWKCGGDIPAVKERFFCHCGIVQPPNPDLTYFEVLGVKETFDLDLETLVKNFKSLQWQLHPDKFSIKSKEEQDYAHEQSSSVNKAFQTIQKPLSRALYLLELKGMAMEEGEIQMDAEFLMHVMEQNEELAEAEEPQQVHEIGQENHSVLLELMQQLTEAFRQQDYSSAKQLVARLKYHSNIDDKVKDWVLQHAAKG